mmetsp:Transcript_34695/g.91628  ORF Transcript_34695/g.91628 Transcript_34695/m.91628 type:complete len:435 (+) Transcript_34695:103-1407(+)
MGSSWSSCCDASVVGSIEQTSSQAPSKITDLDALREQLATMESDREAQDQLFQSLQSSGSIMIATLSIHEQDQARQMKMVGYLRALLALRVWTEDVMLVKPDECKFFVFSASPSALLAAALQLASLAESFPSWLTSVAPEFTDVPLPIVKIGIEAGEVLLLPGDCYGDPVNVASKLGEDLAEDGQLCLGAKFADLAGGDMEAARLLKPLERVEACTEISNVKLQYSKARLCATGLPAASSLPGCMELEPALESSGFREDPCSESRAVFVSDMSGFTSLTKKCGILHYLRLVLNVRSIFKALMQDYGGQIVKYDGDNIIATFPTCHDALKCTEKAWDKVVEYNSSREKDFQIRMGCALSYGDVLLQGAEIMGDAFELAFHLAEEVSEVTEVLVTQRFKERILADDHLSAKFRVSDERLAEHKLHGRLSHHSITFD